MEWKRKRKVLETSMADADAEGEEGDGRGKKVSPICRCLIVKTDEQKKLGEIDEAKHR